MSIIISQNGKNAKKLEVEYIYQPSPDAENRLHQALKMLIKEEDL